MRRSLHYQYEHLLWEDLLLKENPLQTQEVSRLQAIGLSHSSSGYLLYERGLLASWVKLALLTGKLPEKDKAKKYLANFKLIPKRLLGTSLKLEKILIYAYMEKLLFFVFPKIRGFQGLVFVQKKTQENLQSQNFNSFSTTFDKGLSKLSSGKTFGLKQLTFFPEVEETSQWFEEIGGIHCSFNTNQPSFLPLLLTGLHFPCKTL